MRGPGDGSWLRHGFLELCRDGLMGRVRGRWQSIIYAKIADPDCDEDSLFTAAEQ